MKTAFLHGATYRADGQPDTVWTKEVQAKEAPLAWQEKGLTYTSTGYGSRIPTRYMVFFNGRCPLPRMGSEMVCAIRPDPKFPSFRSRLMVQNISGDFYLCSPNANIPQWPGMFGVEVQV